MCTTTHVTRICLVYWYLVIYSINAIQRKNDKHRQHHPTVCHSYWRSNHHCTDPSNATAIAFTDDQRVLDYDTALTNVTNHAEQSIDHVRPNMFTIICEYDYSRMKDNISSMYISFYLVIVIYFITTIYPGKYWFNR